MADAERTELETTGVQDLLADSPQSSAVAQVFAETQAQVILAKRYPRSYNLSWGRMQEMTRRKSLALKARYSYPRGGKSVQGGSVYLARPLAQCWGNLMSGFRIIADTEEDFTIEGWAWDLETNYRTGLQKIVKKLIYRKDGGWLKPDERDLGELINREGAKLLRNAIFGVIPTDFTEDALAMCAETLKKDIKDPKSASKELIKDFMDKYGVKVADLSKYVGTEDWTTEAIVDLQTVLNTLNDGEAKVGDYFKSGKTEPKKNKLDLKKMKPGDKKKHQSVKGKTTSPKKKAKKHDPMVDSFYEAAEDEVEKGKQVMDELDKDEVTIAELLQLAELHEPVMSQKLKDKAREMNLKVMSADGLAVVKAEIEEAVEEADRIRKVAKK